MKISSISVEPGPFPAPFALTENDSFSRSWVTVLIGPNGSRKSLLLRVLTEAGLGLHKFKGHGHPTLNCTLNMAYGQYPSRVIALSGTPLDRFPRVGARGWSVKSGLMYRPTRFVYIGQRAGNGMASVSESERSLSRRFLEHAARLEACKNALDAVFEHLGLSSKIGIRLRRTSALNVRGKPGPRVFSTLGFDKYLSAQIERMPVMQDDPSMSPEWRRELYAFVSRLKADAKYLAAFKTSLSNLHESGIAFWLSTEGHHIHIGFSTITEWRCAIDLGFVEVEGLNLAHNGSKSFPSLASDSPRESDLSSGQWNWLSTLAGLALEVMDDSLVLIDEPENSLHPTWQREYISVLETVLNSKDGCHAVVATHSAFIAAGVSKENGNVMAIAPVENEDNSAVKVIARSVLPTFGWSANDVYREVFGMESTRAPEFIDRADHALAMVSDGIDRNIDELSAAIPQLEKDLKTLPAHDTMRQVISAIISDVTDERDQKS